MAVKFIEPGGDAEFSMVNGGVFWASVGGSVIPAVATDFVHGTHIKSIKYDNTGLSRIRTATGVLTDAGSRISFYLYLNALPSSTSIICAALDSGFSFVVRISLSSSGILSLTSGGVTLGTGSTTLSTGTWYRISLAYTIASSTVNEFRLFINGISEISVTNGSLAFTSTSLIEMGNSSANTSLDMRTSDHYADNSSSLTDPGNIWITAKRPNANGTINGFTTQIGSGGSGYGSGHSPQVNERPYDTTNGWKITTAGSAITEEYNIESASTGDIDISSATIIDYVGWVKTSATLAETAQIIVNNVTSNISIPSGNVITVFTAFASSATYPAGSGKDIGEITSTTVTTVSLYECGIVVAYIPSTGNLPLLGVG